MTEPGEIPSPSEIRPETTQKIDFANRIIAGDYAKDYPSEESLDPKETFSGPLLDLNDEHLSQEERELVVSWIEDKLGSSAENAPIRKKYRSPDSVTKVTIFDVEIGDDWYLSKWHDEAKKESYIFWPQEVYDWQLEEGYVENYSQAEIVEILRRARERTGTKHPDDLDLDDPAGNAFVVWCAQENPYESLLPPKAAEYKWDLDKTMAYFDAGFDDPDYLDELASDFLIQDLDNAEAEKNEDGMEDVIEQINDAIKRVDNRSQSQ